MRRGQRQIEQVKIKMALQLDDRTFQLMLADTQVVQTKDHNKWNYEILVDLFEGPLLGPKRIEEAFRTSKFGKRLMAFWHPSSKRFSELRRNKVRIPSIHIPNSAQQDTDESTLGQVGLLSSCNAREDTRGCQILAERRRLLEGPL